jgi:hypothetical protein
MPASYTSPARIVKTIFSFVYVSFPHNRKNPLNSANPASSANSAASLAIIKSTSGAPGPSSAVAEGPGNAPQSFLFHDSRLPNRRATLYRV